MYAGTVSEYNCSGLTPGVGYMLYVETFLDNDATQFVKSSVEKALTGSHIYNTLTHLSVHIALSLS